MYLKSLVGRAAGSVIDMPKTAADSALLNGTHVAATEEEIMAAGYVREPVQSDAAPATLPEGYKVVRYPGGDGFELRHSDDTPAADTLFPNMLAAYEHARAKIAGAAPVEVAPVVAAPEPIVEAPAADPEAVAEPVVTEPVVEAPVSRTRK